MYSFNINNVITVFRTMAVMHFVFTYCSLKRISLPPSCLPALFSSSQNSMTFLSILVDISSFHLTYTFYALSSRVFLNFYVLTPTLFSLLPPSSFSPLAYFSLKIRLLCLRLYCVRRKINHLRLATVTSHGSQATRIEKKACPRI